MPDRPCGRRSMARETRSTGIRLAPRAPLRAFFADLSDRPFLMAKKGVGPTSRLERAVEDLRRGKLSGQEFLREVAPYAVREVGEVARLDTGRHARIGVPEAVLAEGKDDATLAAVVRAAVAASGRCLVTRLPPARGKKLARALGKIKVELYPVAHGAVCSNGKT